jgi:hypothetical protein
MAMWAAKSNALGHCLLPVWLALNISDGANSIADQDRNGPFNHNQAGGYTIKGAS